MMREWLEKRFERQLKLLGIDGQLRLANSSALIAGLGGLGSAASLYLTAAGIGRLVLIDNGVLELSNLNRQILYTTEDLGRPKALAAAERLRALNPHTDIEAHVMSVKDAGIENLVSDVDVILDCLDNWDSRMALDKLSWTLRKPLIHGGVNAYYGQVTTVVPGETPCLKCILGPARSSGRESPQVLGPTAGVVGVLQAAEAVKLLAGVGELLKNKLLIVDLKRMEFTVLKLIPPKECVCW